MTIEGIERASKNGAYCVGITDSMLSPLARFANELFIVPINSLSFAASYVAPLALIDLITAGVGSLRRKQVVGRLKEAIRSRNTVTVVSNRVLAKVRCRG